MLIIITMICLFSGAPTWITLIFGFLSLVSLLGES